MDALLSGAFAMAVFFFFGETGTFFWCPGALNSTLHIALLVAAQM